jgi:hypothetical protein
MEVPLVPTTTLSHIEQRADAYVRLVHDHARGTGYAADAFAGVRFGVSRQGKRDQYWLGAAKVSREALLAALVEAATPALPIEQLSDALDAALRCGDFDTCADARAWVRADNRLLDACFAAGMGRDHDDHRAWAADAVATWLFSGREAA